MNMKMISSDSANCIVDFEIRQNNFKYAIQKKNKLIFIADIVSVL